MSSNIIIITQEEFNKDPIVMCKGINVAPGIETNIYLNSSGARMEELIEEGKETRITYYRLNAKGGKNE